MLTRLLWALVTASAVAMALILAVHTGAHTTAVAHHVLVGAARPMGPVSGPPLTD